MASYTKQETKDLAQALVNAGVTTANGYTDDQIAVLQGEIDGLAGGFQGSLAMGDTPVNDGVYFPSESGTYANAGGLVVDLSAGLTYIVKSGSTYTMNVVPISLSGYFTKAETEDKYGVESTSRGDYAIKDGNGKIAFYITKDGLVRFKCDDNTAIDIFSKLGFIKTTNGSLTIVDSNGNIAFAILKSGLVSANFTQQTIDKIIEGIAGSTPKISGKKISILGDSISTDTGGGSAGLVYPQQYWGHLQDENGCTIFRNAIAGSNITHDGTTNSFTDDSRWSTLSSIVPDIVLIFGGINDWLEDVPLGALGDTDRAASFYGGLDYLYKKILTANPNAKVFHMTPTHTKYATGGGLVPEYNGQNYLSEFIEAIEKVSRRYGVGIIDTNRNSGITCFNIDTLAADKIHFNATGHEMVYNCILSETEVYL